MTTSLLPLYRGKEYFFCPNLSGIKMYWLFAFICIHSTTFSQQFQPSPIKLEEVSFFDSGDGGKIDIYNDVAQTLKHDNPAWRAGRSLQEPVAYASTTKAKISAVFDLKGCSLIGSTVWVKGDGPGNWDAPPQVLSAIGVYAPTELKEAFGTTKKVDFYEPFTITWKIACTNSNNDLDWQVVGTSSHPLYLTYDKPTAKVFHTLIYYGCKNAVGATVPLDIVNQMYTGTFVGRSIPRKDGKPVILTYWKDTSANKLDSIFCYSTAGLLFYGDATCGAFADFFVDMIKTQGITGSAAAEVTSTYISGSGYDLGGAGLTEFSADKSALLSGLAPPVPGGGWLQTAPDYNDNGIAGDDAVRAFFFVNNWSFSGLRSFYGIKTSPVLTYTSGSTKTIPAADDTGVGGQNNDNPRAYFENHALVKFDGKYYDPSYGSAAPVTAAEWETNALSGFGTFSFLISVDMSGTIIKTEPTVWLNRSNTSAIQVNINP